MYEASERFGDYDEEEDDAVMPRPGRCRAAATGGEGEAYILCGRRLDFFSDPTKVTATCTMARADAQAR